MPITAFLMLLFFKTGKSSKVNSCFDASILIPLNGLLLAIPKKPLRSKYHYQKIDEINYGKFML